MKKTSRKILLAFLICFLLSYCLGFILGSVFGFILFRVKGGDVNMAAMYTNSSWWTVWVGMAGTGIWVFIGIPLSLVCRYLIKRKLRLSGDGTPVRPKKQDLL